MTMQEFTFGHCESCRSTLTQETNVPAQFCPTEPVSWEVQVPNAIKLGFVGLNCKDVDRIKQHFTEMIGLPQVLDAGTDA